LNFEVIFSLVWVSFGFAIPGNYFWLFLPDKHYVNKSGNSANFIRETRQKSAPR
jgi:hypothetical protein